MKISTLIITAVFFLVSSCAAIPANKIKVEDYPQIDPSNEIKISLKYETFKFEPDKKGYVFDSAALLKLNKNIKSDAKASCTIKISTMHSAPFPRVCIANYFLAGFTLFAIPYYCQHTYEIKSSLISYPKDSQIYGTIKTSIREAKLGDIFLDENDRPAKLLKTYEIKDKVHEVWSLLMILAAIPIKSLRELPSDESGKRIVENNVSEALVRQIIHDASTFEECQKSPSNKK